jgi:hypothetical protein
MYSKACAPNTSIQKTISALSDTAEVMVDLRVLRDIEETVDELVKTQRGIAGVTQLARDTEADIKAEDVKVGVFIDENGKLEEGMRTAIAQSERILISFAGKKAAIDKDRNLREHHREDLLDAFNGTVDALALMIESMKDVVAALITHDLAAEPRNGTTYPDIRDLHADLVKQ